MANQKHSAKWHVDVDISNPQHLDVACELIGKSTDAVEERNPAKGNVRVHMLHQDIKDSTDELKFTYKLRKPPQATFTKCTFSQKVGTGDPDGTINFSPPVIDPQNGKSVEFKDLRKSEGTWKCIFEIEQGGVRYEPDPEITNENLEFAKRKLWLWIAVALVAAAVAYWLLKRN